MPFSCKPELNIVYLEKMSFQLLLGRNVLNVLSIKALKLTNLTHKAEQNDPSLLPAKALTTGQPEAMLRLRRNRPWWQVTFYLGADRGKEVSHAVRAEGTEEVMGVWGWGMRRNGTPFTSLLFWVMCSTAVMVHTSTCGLKSAQTELETVPQECGGRETQHPEYCLPII